MFAMAERHSTSSAWAMMLPIPAMTNAGPAAPPAAKISKNPEMPPATAFSTRAAFCSLLESGFLVVPFCLRTVRTGVSCRARLQLT